jgi:CheY-like chemotaxis protein
VKKIMIVDDEKDILEYLTTLFKDHGYETVTAADGKEALEMIRKEKPDLVTLDIIMPSFYREVKKDDELKKIPVVIVTALTGWGYDPEGFHKFIKSRKQVPPPEGFLAKPVDTEKLLQLVKEHLS